MKNIKYFLGCFAITFAMILIVEGFLVGLALTLHALGLDDGSLGQLLPYTNWK